MSKLEKRLLASCLPLLFLVAACGGGQETVSTGAEVAPAPAAGEPAAPAPDEPGPPALEAAGEVAAEPDDGRDDGRDAGLKAVEEAVAGQRGDRPAIDYVAVVNGERVPFVYLEQRLATMHTGQAESRRSGYDLDRLMFKVVNDILLGQEARAAGMDEEPPVKRQVEKYREDLVIAALEQDQVASKAVAGEDEIRREFEKQYSRVTLRVVTVDERSEAEALIEEIRAGADMAALAHERSVDPYAARGGLIEDVPRRDLAAEVGALAASLEPGRLGGPVGTDLGWSVIRLESFAGPDGDLFDGVRAELAGIVRLEKRGRLRAELAERIRASHPVEMNREAIDAIEPQRLSDGRLVPQVGDRGDVVATVGSLPITAGEYADALMLRWSGVRSEDAARAAAPIILATLVEKKLLLAEAKTSRFATLPEIEEQVRVYETQVLVRRYLEDVVAAGITVSAEELQACYEENRSRLQRPPRLNLGQITVPDKAQAEEMARLLREGTDLAWLARRHSTDRFAEDGGVRGWTVPSPGVDDFQDRLIASRTGDVLGPVGVPGNWNVIKVLAREDQGTYSLTEVSGNMRNMVFSEKFRKVLDEYMTKLRERSEIEINEEALASLSISGAVEEQADGGEEGGAHGH